MGMKQFYIVYRYPVSCLYGSWCHAHHFLNCFFSSYAYHGRKGGAMISTDPSKTLWPSVISAFIHERLRARLDKLADDDPRRPEVLAQHVPGTWLADAAWRVAQIQAVTHSLKPIHPDARGTNLYVEPSALPVLAELGSHALVGHFATDVVGNAAALDVYKLLKLEVNGRSLLTALLAQDADALTALHPDAARHEHCVMRSFH
nr:type I-F CRISPR-associated protein Csy1 [Paracidovorax cattleyae]